MTYPKECPECGSEEFEGIDQTTDGRWICRCRTCNADFEQPPEPEPEEEL